MLKKILILTLLSSNLFSQANLDARMLGLNGAYTTMAKGFKTVGINPANLAVYQGTSLNIIDFSLGLSNNYLSIQNYNALMGSHLSDTTHHNYYPREKIFSQFRGKGLQLNQTLNIPLPVVNISTRNMALSSRLKSNISVGLADGVIKFLLSGNPYEEPIDLSMQEILYTTQEIGFSYGHKFQGFSAGVTAKYLLGLFYMGIESISSSTIITDLYGTHGNPQYVIRQAIGGNGLGLDVGMTTNESKDGFRFGASIINLLGTIKWTRNNFIRDQLEPSLSEMGDFYLRPNELMYVNLVLDSIAVSSLYDETIEEPLIYYEMYQVIPQTVPIEDDSLSGLVVALSDGTYLNPTGLEYTKVDLLQDTTYVDTLSDNYSNNKIGNDNPFKTREPMYIRMGISKRWENQGIVAVDLVTGFSNRFNSSSIWRLSIGGEITRFKNKYLRMGYAIGGLEKKSLSFGYGSKMGSIYFDIGFSFNGGFSLYSVKGFDLGVGLFWNLTKKD